MTGTNHVLLLSCLLSRLTSLFGDPASGHQQWSLWGTCPSSHAATWECTPNATIHQIQGIRQYSPLAGEFVAVAGIVTGIVDHSGFYMQDPVPDDDPRTSEGIYVYTHKAGLRAANVFVGNAVTVRGIVAEFAFDAAGLPLTEIVSDVADKGVTKCPSLFSQGAAIQPTLIGCHDSPERAERTPPLAVIKNDGLNDTLDIGEDGLDFYESLEGMLVAVEDPIAVGATDRFAAAWVVSNRGACSSGFNTRKGITADPGTDDFNPERIQLVASPAIPRPSPFTIGDTLVNKQAQGIMSYGWDNFRLLLTESITPESGGLQPTSNSIFGPEDAATHLTFGSYNIENFHISGKRPARIAQQIVEHLGSPAVLALQEIQDNNGPSPGPFEEDGTSPANRTLQGLIDLIASRGGPTYMYTTVNPMYGTTGGQPGGNIRNAILYNPQRVRLLPSEQGPGGATDSVEPILDDDDHLRLSHNPGLIDPNSYLWLESRRPLVAHFQHCGTGKTFIVVVCHLRAKFEGQLYGIRQPPFNGGLRDGPVSRDNATVAGGRTEQGIRVRAWVDSVIALDNATDIIVAGDMNEFQYVGPVDSNVEGSLTHGPEGLVDLITTLPAEDRFSYTFQGNSEVLDHVLVRRATANRTAYEEIHINAFLPHAQQASDHDPPIAKIELGSTAIDVPETCGNP